MNMNVTKIFVSRIAPWLSHRMYVTRPTRPLQKIFGFGKSEKEKEIEETHQKAKETTAQLKERAQVVKETTETVIGFGKDMKAKWDETGDAIAKTGDKIASTLKEPIKEAVHDACKNTTKKIEDKVAEKITDRVMKKDDQPKNTKETH